MSKQKQELTPIKSRFDRDKSELTIKDVARMGGEAVKKKYGKEYFRELIKKRWEKKNEEK